MDSVLLHKTHAHTYTPQKQCVEEDYAGLNFNRKNPRLQALRSKSGFRNFPHPRASWYNRRLNLKSCDRNMFIFEDAGARLQMDNRLLNQQQCLQGKKKKRQTPLFLLNKCEDCTLEG